MIYLDRASIHNELLRRHPEIDPNRSSCSLSSNNGGPFAWLFDGTACQAGSVEIARDDEREDYFGFEIGIVRWRNCGLGEEAEGR